MTSNRIPRRRLPGLSKLSTATPSLDSAPYTMAHEKKRGLKDLVKPDKFIIKKLRTLAQATSPSSTSKPQTLSDLNLLLNDLELTEELTSEEVQMKMETLAISLRESLQDCKGFSITLPATINPSQRRFSIKKGTLILCMLSKILDICTKNIHITKEDLFSTDARLFKDPTESEAILEGMLGCTRSSLNIIEDERGRVVGRLMFIQDGCQIDCTKTGESGFSISPTIHGVDDMSSDALFILLVDKSDTYSKLAREKFYNRFPCIIITGNGEASVGTRLFLSKMKRELKLPVLALTDSDPKSLKMLSVFGSGPKSMSTPGIKWLGVRPSDLDAHQLPKNCRVRMTKQDIKICEDLLKGDFVKKNPGWVKELETMMKSKEKVEIEAFCTFGFEYQTGVFLPLKFQHPEDWL